MFVAYLTDSEPLTLEEVKYQCRIDEDMTGEDLLIANVIIPGARGLAESMTGSAIRSARYREKAADLEGVSLSVGMVTAIESITVDGVAILPADYELNAELVRAYVSSEKYAGKSGVVTYTAGTNLDRHPSVKNWMLYAAGWMYMQRETVVVESAGVTEMPRSYMDAMLAPIKLPAGF